MAIEITRVPNADASEPEERVFALQVIGKVEKADFDVLGPRLDGVLEEHGKLSLLIELVDFEGWTAGAAWEDIKFALKHFSDIERIAVVGDSRWEHGMTVLAKPFTAADVRYFDVEDKEAAARWVRQRNPRDDGEPQ